MKYVVTGGAGFIGSNLVDRLVEEGHDVTVIDNISTGKEDNINKHAKLELHDISYTSTEHMHKLTEVMIGTDTVFHLAALARVQPSIKDPDTYNKANVNGTLNVLTAAKNADVRRVVYSASSSAYGDATIFPTPETHPTDPLSPYGLQKLIGEQYCRVFYHCYGLETVCLRYFNVFGERQSLDGAYKLVMGSFADQLLKGNALTITGDGEQRRDFTYVKDVVMANILASRSKHVGKGESINIGRGDNRSVNQIADLFGGPKKYIEKCLEPQQTLADNTKAKQLLSWQPTVTVEDWIPEYKKQLGI